MLHSRIKALDGRLSRPMWVLILIGGALVWLVPAVVAQLWPTFFDWQIYRHAAQLWQATGSPYSVPPPGWDAATTFPYLYPPTSWPLLVLVETVSPALLALGLVPFAAITPRVWASPAVGMLLFVAAAPALLLGNVNALVGGALVVAFVPGVVGGIGFAVAVALKGYPILLVPLLWADRRRMVAAAVLLSILIVSGTYLWGLESWMEWFQSLTTQGRYGDTLNPLADNRAAALAAAALTVVMGLGAGSPTLVLVGATLATPALFVHYLLTYAAGLVQEPQLAGRLRRVLPRRAGDADR